MSESTPTRCESVVPTLCVGDVSAAIDWYRDALGFEELWRWGEPAVHASVRLGEAEVHLSCNAPDPGGSWLYFTVEDVDALHERLCAREDVQAPETPADQEWGMREFHVTDLVGNALTFAARCPAAGPEVPVEREEVTVRLERRILAVLRDLAAHKGMDLTGALEETLMHTFEALPGGGVASPHTAADLRRIAELKRAHALDVDAHATYRFVERDDA